MAGQPKRGCGPVYVWNCVMWLMHLNATWQKLNPSIAGKTLWNKVRVSIKLNCPARFCTQILSVSHFQALFKFRTWSDFDAWSLLMTGGRAKSCKIHEHAISYEISEICSNLKHQVTGSKLAGDFIKPPGKWDHHQNIEETIHHHILQYLPTTSKKKTWGMDQKPSNLLENPTSMPI